jgi:hypothetical protein
MPDADRDMPLAVVAAARGEARTLRWVCGTLRDGCCREPMNRAGGLPAEGGTPPWLHEKLYERRIVLVTGWLDDAVAARAAAALTSLDAASDAPIEIQVDSPDGTLESRVRPHRRARRDPGTGAGAVSRAGRHTGDRCRGCGSSARRLAARAVPTHPAERAVLWNA